MERIENPEKYQSKVPWKIRLKKLLFKNIIWVPIVFLFLGLVAMLLLYQQHKKNEVTLGVNYGATVNRDDYQKQEVKSRLEQFQDKIFEKEQVKRRGRYDHIVSGKDVVSVDFGQRSFPQEKTKLDDAPEQKDTVQNPKATKAVSRPVRRPMKASSRKKKIVKTDTVEADTMISQPSNPFASIRLVHSDDQKFILAYVYGDQEVESGTFIKLQLGESLEVQSKVIPTGTVFTGKINMSANAIHIKVDRIHRYDVDYEVYDSDYSHGIIINRSKNQDMESAANTTVYRSAGRSVVDLPYEILQDVTQSVIRNKRKRQRTIKLNDGYTLYLAKG